MHIRIPKGEERERDRKKILKIPEPTQRNED